MNLNMLALRERLCSQDSYAENAAASALCRQGSHLSVEDVHTIEAELSACANDLGLHLILVGYFFFNQHRLQSALEQLFPHVAWVVDHAPHLSVAGSPYCLMAPDAGMMHDTIKQLWLRQVAAHVNSAPVLRNAAKFFSTCDARLSEELIGRGLLIEPANPMWFLYRSQLHMQLSGGLSGKEQLAAIHQSRTELENGLKLCTSDDQRLVVMICLAKSSLLCNESEEAQRYASALLTLAESSHVPHSQDAIHQAHTILGRLALRRGQISLAKRHLIDSAAVAGSPVLSSFGPNLRLAHELLGSGERDVVISYFQMCRSFWSPSDHRIDEWVDMLQRGGVPSIQSNLDY